MGQIKIEHPDQNKLKELNVPDQPQSKGDWSPWECDLSTFDWHYDQTEVAYVYEGKVKVKTEQEEIEIKKGDLVTFPSGLNCTWNVTEKIKKVYKFI